MEQNLSILGPKALTIVRNLGRRVLVDFADGTSKCGVIRGYSPLRMTYTVNWLDGTSSIVAVDDVIAYGREG